MQESTPSGVADGVPRGDAGASRAVVQLRAIANWLESHPEFEPYNIGFNWRGDAEVRAYGLDGETMAEIARAVGGRWEKATGGVDDELFKLRKKIAPDVHVELIGSRDRVCRRVVTGTREITVTEPAPDAPMVTTTKVVEDVEWVCEPLLGRVA